jgi:predicted DNA-binding transcriptional regulator AlpA
MARPEVTGKKLATRQAELPDHAGRVPLRLLTFKELKALKGVPYSRTQIRRLEQAGTFPMHVTLGDGDGAYIAWVEAEIDDYIVEKMRARPAPAPSGEPTEVAPSSTKTKSGKGHRPTTQSTDVEPVLDTFE